MQKGMIFFLPRKTFVFQSFSFSIMKHPQLPGMERVSTYKYCYAAHYVGHNPSTPCEGLQGPRAPLFHPRLFLQLVLWPLRTNSLCQKGLSRTGTQPDHQPWSQGREHSSSCFRAAEQPESPGKRLWINILVLSQTSLLFKFLPK